MIGGDPAALRVALEVALGVRRVVDEVAAQAPFASRDELLAAHRAATASLSAAELDEALAHHPRIGERPAGDGVAQEFSRHEQSSPDAADPELVAKIAAGNAAYEERFGRVFLIRAAGRSRAEILAELERRLTNEPEAELAEVAEQLRQIAALRLAQSSLEQGPLEQSPLEADA